MTALRVFKRARIPSVYEAAQRVQHTKCFHPEGSTCVRMQNPQKIDEHSSGWPNNHRHAASLAFPEQKYVRQNNKIKYHFSPSASSVERVGNVAIKAAFKVPYFPNNLFP